MTAKTIFCAVLFAGAAWCQSYLGGVRGTVLDGSGKSMGEVKVTLVDEAGGAQRATISGAEGFNFSQVIPATYTVVAEAPGFKRFERKHVIVATQETVSLDLKMEIGSVSESVQVTEEVPLIDTSNASQGQVLAQQLVDLPNLGQSVHDVEAGAERDAVATITTACKIKAVRRRFQLPAIRCAATIICWTEFRSPTRPTARLSFRRWKRWSRSKYSQTPTMRKWRAPAAVCSIRT